MSVAHLMCCAVRRSEFRYLESCFQARGDVLFIPRQGSGVWWQARCWDTTPAMVMLAPWRTAEYRLTRYHCLALEPLFV